MNGSILMSTPGFEMFMGLLAGVLLALAFQAVLAYLSLGAGMSAAGQATKRASESPESSDESDEKEGAGPMARKITSGFGLWALIVTCLALFGASWFGVRLAQTTQIAVGVALALAIWAGSSLITMALQAVAATSIAGSIGSTIKSALQSARESVSSIAQPSEESQAAKTAAEVTASVRRELFGDEDASDFRDRIQDYISQLSPTSAVREERRHFSKEDMEKVRGQLSQFLRSSGKSELQPEALKQGLQQALHDPSSAPDLIRSRLAVLDKPTLTSIVAKSANIPQQEAQSKVDRISSVVNQLRAKFNDRRQQMTGGTSGITQDLQKLFTDPKAGADALIGRLKSLDRDSIKQMVSSRTDMSPQEVEQNIQKIESARDQTLKKAEEMKIEVQRRIEQAKQQAIEAADEARKTAAAAAWWMLGVAICSGICAAIGGWLAVLV